MTPEWVTAIAAGIGAFGIVFVAFQVKIAADQLKQSQIELAADHERSRREHAIGVIRRWTDSLDKTLPAARAFAQELSKDNCKCLIRREPFEVSESYKHLLSHALKDVLENESELEVKNNKIQLNQKHLSHLLALIIQHLNSLEVALLSWMNGVADKDMIESQFQYLVRFEDGHFFLENIREVMAGKASFPAIDLFVDHLTKKYNEAQPKPKTKIA